jgi:tetratricopeptide (TPR) repeat protein
MDNTQFLQLLQQPSFTKHQVLKIQEFVNKYPYFSAAQQLLLLNKIIVATEPLMATDATESLYINNRWNFLYKLDYAKNNSKNPIDELITPAYTSNYFDFEKIETTTSEVESFVEEQITAKSKTVEEDDNSIMITRSFEEWIAYFKQKKEQLKKEEESKNNLKAIWQREKLAAAIEEENDIVPENVFKMAIDSISVKDENVSEPLANILVKQGKIERAVDMYKKLSLLNPQKSAYFAAKIKEITKN